MKQAKLYLSDTTVLIDLFLIREKGYSSTELTNLDNWIDNIASNPETKLLTNTVCALEFIRQLYFDHKLTKRRIDYWITTLNNTFDVEIEDFSFSQICALVKNLHNFTYGSTIDIGEFSLLSYVDFGYDVVVTTSDSGALKSYQFLKRCNPERGPKEYQSGEQYL